MLSSPSHGRSNDNLSPLSPGGRSEYPFHRSRSAQGHPRSRSRRGSTASSIHSVGGALDTASGSWAPALYESGQNAISTLLQPPIVRTGLQPYTSAPTSSQHKPPTARDIPPVALTNIEHVEADEFKPYLAQVGALYEQLRRVKESEEAAAADRRSSRQDEGSEPYGDGYLRPGGRPRAPRKSSNASLTSLNSVESPGPLRRSSFSFSRKAAQGPTPLSTIPTVYFDEDFRLENPRTFDVVSERSEVIRPTDDRSDSNGGVTTPRKALATNAILQEKLSWYMDTIEIHLINSISTASTTFFNALGSLKELHSEAGDSVQRIKVLRQELEALDTEVATNGLEIVHKRRRQENLQQLNDAVLQLGRIVDALADCESLVDAGELDKALASIGSLEKLISGEIEGTDAKKGSQPKLRDLRGAAALQGVTTDLTTLRFRIGKAYEAHFSTLLMGDLRKHVETIAPSEVLLRWSNAANRSRGGHSRTPSVFPTYLAGTEELRSQLLPNMVGLHRANHVALAAVAYKETVLREIRNLIRRPLPSSSDDDNESMMSVSTAGGGRQRSAQEKSSMLARNLRALGPEDSEELLVKIYVSVTETLRRLSSQVKVLLDIASSIPESADQDGAVKSPVTSPRPDRANSSSFELQEELHKTLDIANLLAQAVDIADEKIVKVLKVRAEQTSQLSLDFFLRYFTLNLYFANECEAISGRSGTPLKNVVNGHIRDFVQKNRDAEMQKLAQGMESDQWNARDFSESNTELLDQILECSTHDAPAWTEKTKLWLPCHDVEQPAAETPAETNGNGRERTRNAVIESEKFLLPGSAILCLEGMANFLRLITGIPSMASDVGSSLVAYLQLFNSRCTQLILGAGATKSAGLRNITTKHLALASQALSFIATLVPHIREFVRRHAGSGAGVSSLMSEFDRVRRQLQEHQDSIHQKLVEIMSGRAAVHAKSMKNTDWDSAKIVNPYMETLTKETTTLHRVLTKHLPETTTQMIMVPVFASYKDQLGKALREADPKTVDGRDSMLRDIGHFNFKLSKIGGFGDAGDFLGEIAKSKTIETAEEETAQAADDASEQKNGEEDKGEEAAAGEAEEKPQEASASS